MVSAWGQTSPQLLPNSFWARQVTRIRREVRIIQVEAPLQAIVLQFKAHPKAMLEAHERRCRHDGVQQDHHAEEDVNLRVAHDLSSIFIDLQQANGAWMPNRLVQSLAQAVASTRTWRFSPQACLRTG